MLQHAAVVYNVKRLPAFEKLATFFHSVSLCLCEQLRITLAFKVYNILT